MLLMLVEMVNMFFLILDILTTYTCISNNTYGESDTLSLGINVGNETGSIT